MTTTYRPFGAFNGTLPVPTGMVIGFLRDPASMPYIRYTQFVPAPEIVYEYFTLDPDDPVRLPNTHEYAWGYDDYRPTGKGFTVRGKWTEGRVSRWDFPYTLGEATIRVWRKQGIDPKSLYDQIRANHAALHRAVRVVGALTGATWPTGSSTDLNTLLGTSGAYWDKSSGDQYLSSDIDNPNFQVIKKSFQRVKRRINLATNAVVTGSEHMCVMPPVVAEAVANSGEIVNFLKQNPLVERLVDPVAEDWSLPKRYAGFELVVEDTPRCFINQKADGTVANVTLAAEKDYILTGDTVYFVSRVGGLDGGYGRANFSTVQLYHFNGEGRVEAFSEPKHDLVEGHVVMEDKVETPALISGFKLSDVLST